MNTERRAPVSLSMRMRSEATVPPRTAPEDSTTFPEIPQTTTMPIQRHTLKPNLSLTSSKVERLKMSAEQDLMMEASSGNIDAISSGAAFADRTLMTRPTAACVRCGNHASVCMSCTEYLAEEALNFYRKTRARGAASLFANAITQTGVTKVVKYVMFMMWRNGFRERKWLGRKKEYKVNIMYRDHFLKACFTTWTKETMSCVKENRDKRIIELEKRVETLEVVAKQASNMKDAAERQCKSLQAQFDEFTQTIDIQKERIEALEGTVAEERKRVVGMSSLAAPLLKLDELYQQVYANDVGNVQSKLHRFAQSQLLSYDYGKTYNREDFTDLLEADKKRRNKGKAIDIEDLDPESYEMVEMLLQWASSKSRDANNVMEPGSGKSLGFLPKYKQVQAFPDFKSGAPLLRIVVALLWDLPRVTTEAGQFDKVEASKEGECKGAGEDGVNLDYNAILEQVKGSTKTGLAMTECALALAIAHLDLPKFHVEDLMSCRPEVFCSLLCYLMLGSAAPAQSASSLTKVSKIIETFEKTKGAIGTKRMSLSGLGHAKKIHMSSALLSGLQQEVEEEHAVAAAVALEESQGEQVESGDKEGGDGDGEGEEKKGLGGDEEPAPAPSPAPAVKKYLTPLEKYERLASTIDGYTSSLGSFDPTDLVYAENTAPFMYELEDLQASLGELDTLKATVAEHTSMSDQNAKLAIDVRNALSRFMSEIYLTETKWTGN